MLSAAWWVRLAPSKVIESDPALRSKASHPSRHHMSPGHPQTQESGLGTGAGPQASIRFQEGVSRRAAQIVGWTRQISPLHLFRSMDSRHCMPIMEPVTPLAQKSDCRARHSMRPGLRLTGDDASESHHNGTQPCPDGHCSRTGYLLSGNSSNTPVFVTKPPSSPASLPVSLRVCHSASCPRRHDSHGYIDFAKLHPREACATPSPLGLAATCRPGCDNPHFPIWLLFQSRSHHTEDLSSCGATKISFPCMTSRDPNLGFTRWHD